MPTYKPKGLLTNFQSKILIALGLFTLGLSSLGFAESNPTLEAGVNAYQQSKYDDAKAAFTQLLGEKGWGFVALYNLGDIAMRQKHLGEALAYYRRALVKKPHDPDTLFNIQFVQDALGLHRFTKLTNYDLFRMEVLDRFAMEEFLAATLLLSAAFLWLLLGYLKKRQAYKTEDSTLSVPPSPSLILVGVFLSLFIVSSVLKVVDSYTERATVIAEKADLRSGPSGTNASMMELPEGSEVIVLDSTKDWKQILIPGGSLAGWVQDGAVMDFRGGGPW